VLVIRGDEGNRHVMVLPSSPSQDSKDRPFRV
jgi:hypothetical protein